MRIRLCQILLIAFITPVFMTCPMSHLMEQCGVIVFSCGTVFSINERIFIRHTNIIHTWNIVCSISALNLCFGISDKVFCMSNIIYFVLEYIKLIKPRCITLDLLILNTSNILRYCWMLPFLPLSSILPFSLSLKYFL